MRTLVIGDIHGCLTSLETVLNALELKPEDHLITLGDYIDRGPSSKGVLDRLMQLHECCHFTPLKGNHEGFMQNARLSQYNNLIWTRQGGIPTLVSFDVTEAKDIAQVYSDFIDSCKLYLETEDHIFVHGGLEADKKPEEHEEKTLLWHRFNEQKPHQSGKKIICGHTPDRRIKDVGYAVCVDTHVYHTQGYLTCLDVHSGDFWAGNEEGELLTGKHTFTAR